MGMQADKKIGILGANGTIGLLLQKLLLKENINAEVILGGRNLEIRKNQKKVDIFDSKSLKEFVEQVDLLINCAGPTFLMTERILKVVVPLGKDYIDAFGWIKYHIREDISSRIVLNNGCIPGALGSLVKYMISEDIEDIRVWAGGREIGGKGALGDILLSSINEYGKSGYFIKNFKIEKEEKSIDSKYKIENMPEEVYIRRFLSDEIQKLAERFKLKNISEYKVFPDKITQNYILEGCARCIKEKGDDVRIYNTIFSDILEKIQIQNKSKMNWFALNIEALGRNHRKQLFLRAKDSSCITARMLVYTLKQLLNTNLPPGLYWPYEFVEGESLIAELKKDDLQISEFEEYYI